MAAAMARPLFSPLPPVKSQQPQRCPLLLGEPIYSSSSDAASVPGTAISIAATRERLRLKEVFREARERCHSDPMGGVSFTDEEFLVALDKSGFGSQISKVRGTVIMTDLKGAVIDINAKSSGYLPVQEASIHKIKHVAEAGIYPGLQEEFDVIGKSSADQSLILSLRSIQVDHAWERCQQLQDEDGSVKGKVAGRNKGGVIVTVECLEGFVPFSYLPKNSTAEELTGKVLFRFVEIDKKLSKLILGSQIAFGNRMPQLGIGSVVQGTVQNLKPYGALINVGGNMTGLLHVSQISHSLISDIGKVIRIGDSLKVMVLSHDQESSRLGLSTKNLEPSPGDMIHNPKLVFKKAEEMAENFRQRLAEAETTARCEMFRNHNEVAIDKY